MPRLRFRSRSAYHLTKACCLLVCLVSLPSVVYPSVSTSTACRPDPPFFVTPSIPVNHRTGSLVFGDLNNDQRPDLIVANPDIDGISVLLNTTPPRAIDPAFAVLPALAAGDAPTAIAVGDLNNDQEPDLAIVNSVSKDVSVLINITPRGASTPLFASQQRFPVGGLPNSVAIGDVNSDGWPDLVIGSAHPDNQVRVLLNESATSSPTMQFSNPQIVAAGDNLSSIMLSDLNDDGRLDVVVGYFDRVGVLLNSTMATTSAMTFGTQQFFPTNPYVFNVAVGDVDGDQRLDLAVQSGSAGTVSVLRNQMAPGDLVPSFAAAESFLVVIPNRDVTAVAMGDINDDHRLDLVATADGVSVLLNTSLPNAAALSFTTAEFFAAGGFPDTALVSDLNGDQRPDVAILNGETYDVSILVNTTTAGESLPEFVAAQVFTMGHDAFWLTVDDFNSDGRLDLASGGGDASFSYVAVRLNATSATTSPLRFSPTQQFAVSYIPHEVLSADINQDHRPDLIAPILIGYNQSGGGILLNTSEPQTPGVSFTRPQPFAISDSHGDTLVVDVNNDQRPDLITTDLRTDRIGVLLNITEPGALTTTFAAPREFAAGDGRGRITTADLNMDHQPDLIAADMFSNTVSLLLNTTPPGAAIPSFADRQAIDVQSPNEVIVGDLNNDDRPDLLVTGYISGTYVLMNTSVTTATMSFAAPLLMASSFTASDLVLADVDGDGRRDLIITNSPQYTVSVWRNTTRARELTPHFSLLQQFVTVRPATAVKLADLNSDGRNDLIMATGANIEVVLGQEQQVRLLPTAGNMQSTGINTRFATALQAQVTDGCGSAIAGVEVTFTTSKHGPSASISQRTVTTDLNGLASITATANGIPGSYAVIATIAGTTTSLSYTLTNSLETYLPLMQR
jgi:FG-GAP-like repeat